MSAVSKFIKQNKARKLSALSLHQTQKQEQEITQVYSYINAKYKV